MTMSTIRPSRQDEVAVRSDAAVHDQQLHDFQKHQMCRSTVIVLLDFKQPTYSRLEGRPTQIRSHNAPSHSSDTFSEVLLHKHKAFTLSFQNSLHC